jgi:hypothetical protein
MFRRHDCRSQITLCLLCVRRIKDYQAVRFRMYVEQAAADASAGKSSVCEACFVAAFRARQQQWVHEPWNSTSTLLPAEPVGDTVAIARKLQRAHATTTAAA